ncbi:MAG: hypothetical protein QOF06_1243 [Solirubrobacterales bacterium]|jgi:hypothetical protein|nr:hypothetical protein [Solirubrobacterales bacterium]
MANGQTKKPEEDGVPAYFLEALLTTDIPPYLTEASGVTKLFFHDPLATKMAAELNRLPDREPRPRTRRWFGGSGS